MNPIALYRKSNAIQYAWIRKHPFQYIALNAIVLVVGIGYVTYKDRKAEREFAESIETQKTV